MEEPIQKQNAEVQVARERDVESSPLEPPFLMAQYESLRAELLGHIEETRKLELTAVAGVAALYAWFATREVPLDLSTWFIALLIPLFGGLRSLAIFRRVKLLATFLREQIEPRILSQDSRLLGWETYFENHLQQAKPVDRPKERVSFTAAVFWLVLLAITLLAPFVLRSGPSSAL